MLFSFGYKPQSWNAREKYASDTIVVWAGKKVAHRGVRRAIQHGYVSCVTGVCRIYGVWSSVSSCGVAFFCKVADIATYACDEVVQPRTQTQSLALEGRAITCIPI